MPQNYFDEYYDCIIVGQGITGTLLAYNLRLAGKRVLVVDKALPNSASKVACGLLNPVTGKRAVTTWQQSVLWPVAIQTYRALEHLLQIPLLKEEQPIVFHATAEDHQLYQQRAQISTLVQPLEATEALQQQFHASNGISTVKDAYILDIRALLSGYRLLLQEEASLLHEVFDFNELKLVEQGVQYKGIQAKKLILCTGFEVLNQPFFQSLPFSCNKGEALIASIPGLSPQYTYSKGLKIAPWQDGLFWVGASFDWHYTDSAINPAYVQTVANSLATWLKLPYTIVDHMAGIRPSSLDHKPYLGFHPVYEQIGIFNGMGTKGCSQSPYYAQQLVQHILQHTPLDLEVSIARCKRILLKTAI